MLRILFALTVIASSALATDPYPVTVVGSQLGHEIGSITFQSMSEGPRLTIYNGNFFRFWGHKLGLNEFGLTNLRKLMERTPPSHWLMPLMEKEGARGWYMVGRHTGKTRALPGVWGYRVEMEMEIETLDSYVVRSGNVAPSDLQAKKSVLWADIDELRPNKLEEMRPAFRLYGAHLHPLIFLATDLSRNGYLMSESLAHFPGARTLHIIKVPLSQLAYKEANAEHLPRPISADHARNIELMFGDAYSSAVVDSFDVPDRSTLKQATEVGIALLIERSSAARGTSCAYRLLNPGKLTPLKLP